MKNIKILIIIFFLVVIQFIFMGKGVNFGKSAKDMDNKIKELSEENDKIELEISSLSSYVVLSSKLSNLNFIDPIKSLNNNGEVALKP